MASANHIANRDAVLQDLRAELVGPRPAGDEVDLSSTPEFEEGWRSYLPRREAGTGHEILTAERPRTRYGVGVLNPVAKAFSEDDEDDEGGPGEIPDEEEERETPEVERFGSAGGEADDADFDLSLTGSFRPCSMAVSFLARVPEGGRLEVTVKGGRYLPVSVKIEGKERYQPWWLRRPVELVCQTDAAGLASGSAVQASLPVVQEQNTEGLDLQVDVLSRPYEDPLQRLITVSLVNRSDVEGPWDAACLFQSAFSVRLVDRDGNGTILPYPSGTRLAERPGERRGERAAREEEASLSLLYRKARTYAVGHGCAADWKAGAGGDVAQVSAECMPVFETRSMTPDIKRPDGTDLKVSMAALAGINPDDDGMDALGEVVELYRDWISDRRGEIPALAEEHREAARRHIERAARCADRMESGIRLIEQDEEVRRAFRLANHAILIQQIRSAQPPRPASYNTKELLLFFEEAPPDPDLLDPPANKGYWRAFQIAFLVMALQGTAEKGHPEREIVELIWFPTGGGKTEAYLGLAAFSIFLRYLRDPEDHGVHVLMRYTLRLLTAQQFQRASRLICAMEHLRRRELPDVRTPISIGIWLGGSTTPNTRNQAIGVLRDLRSERHGTENKFVLGSCPWCGAEMGPVDLPSRHAPTVLGYERREDTVAFYCPDPTCEFSEHLPVYVIDEDVYEARPDLVIGTVDKFAMLAWRPQARCLFGLDEDGERMASPPGLIIQDELHLISGPLGSMVGLYEGLIEDLCTDRRGDEPVRPRIVSSTATIRRYEDQIRCLYGRDRVTLFPPPGLEEGDSFFARYAVDEEGAPVPGKKYVGVHAPGLSSMQTVQVRTFGALLMSPQPLSPRERDPWWTLLAFYNSLRELGGALSLFQADIPEYIRGMKTRYGLKERRFLDRVLELTGRVSSQEVTEAIGKLERTTTGAKPRPIDACLASNIIEVGVDIERLSLMAVVGQPKTTSQYIQVTGRVGRQWWERPGLVVTLYSSSKPRDRSHFEKFRSYHERLYAQVEPTSVTPFSPPALDRALHAVMVTCARQYGGQEDSPSPVPEQLLEHLRDLLLSRIETVDPRELDNFRAVFERRLEEWRRRGRSRWEEEDGDPGLMHVAGEYVPQDHRGVTWPVPMSMRNVDAECRMEVELRT